MKFRYKLKHAQGICPRVQLVDLARNGSCVGPTIVGHSDGVNFNFSTSIEARTFHSMYFSFGSYYSNVGRLQSLLQTGFVSRIVAWCCEYMGEGTVPAGQ